MTTLTFNESDLWELLELLIQAVELTQKTGQRPEVEVNGKLYAPFELEKVARILSEKVGYEEPLQPHHQTKIDKIFLKKQHGYGRTGYNLATRANQIYANRHNAMYDELARRQRYDGAHLSQPPVPAPRRKLLRNWVESANRRGARTMKASRSTEDGVVSV